jgi:hypothetical protein
VATVSHRESIKNVVNGLLTATVVVLVSLLVYLQYVGVSPRTVAIIAVVAFFTVGSTYIFLKRRRLSSQGIPRQATDWRRLAFLIVVGLAVWIALIFRFM